MVATPIAASNRYIPEGNTRFYFVATMATYTSPSRSELNAGTDLTPEIMESGDWSITSDAVDTPDLASTYTAQIPGKTSTDGTTINMYADVAAADVRTLLPRGTTGYIVKFPGGDVTSRKMDVFPIRVASQGKPTSMGNASVIALVFYVSRIPAENVAVP